MAANKIIRTATVAMSLNILLKGQLRYLNQFFDVLAVSGYDADLETVKNREGVSIVSVTMKRSIAPFQDLISLYRLYKLFKKERPTIVHSITPKAGLLSMVAAKYANVPVRIHTFTGLVFPAKKGLFQKLLILMDKVLCWHATHIIPEGAGVKQDLLDYKITKKPLEVIANGNVNGIDTTFFNSNTISEQQQQNLRNELGIDSSDFVFVFIGRLVADKGINELVRAFLSLEIPNCKLLLVGPYETEDPLQPKTLKAIQQNDSILSVGFQHDVRPYLVISDCLVFPSYREGFPNVVMQAGAMGLPSIVTDINGSNEIIIEGFNGTIVPSKNVTALLRAMIRIKEDETWRNQLQSNARSSIISRYEQELVWEALLIKYKEFLKVQ
ncbi:glycosyltransferase family 4 protein [Flavobacterium cheniae]|uniref:Glycosyltransferase involved in cell wall biosynthesis n=1 Tax=Flavobacterium cheniae TaxID=295428 RepID=A0A562KPA6_9FLAO|nr:glycosyltransferase family 4 protein [Flavobacterium cheniae]TDR22938.1 glycosyltransferase involved in cell wall biosynthesis [Flavobacterium cheniae]TWH97202.1 glycosyltransferase involved in cell wall biosynthesis [Flavobacterium cheniae]